MRAQQSADATTAAPAAEAIAVLVHLFFDSAWAPAVGWSNRVKRLHGIHRPGVAP